MTAISTFLWYDSEALEAAEFYTSLFPDGRISLVAHYGSAGPLPAGTVSSVEFELAGQRFMSLNGGPEFRFTEAISIMVRCDDQEEVDRLWEALTAGGEPGPCGWLKDRYGLSWQIAPELLFTLINDPDEVRAQAATAAMLRMKKLDSQELQAAFDAAR